MRPQYHNAPHWLPQLESITSSNGAQRGEMLCIQIFVNIYTFVTNILAIETSCDETAIAILSATESAERADFRLRANIVHSQIAIHAPYGGVFPALAKREHSRNLVPVLKEALTQGFGISQSKFLISRQFPKSKLQKLNKLLEREPELLEQFLREIPKLKKPRVGVIAVTHGPGLEPALWVGINFAKALSLVWGIPVIPINHMEGHLFSPFIKSGGKFKIPKKKSQFPILALLVSGGHTELVLIKKWGSYKKIGETQDDAAGEAFDKVARMLGLPYPGGPAIAQMAALWNDQVPSSKEQIKLPRPMISSGDLNFSFSGLKTAVMYLLRENEKRAPLSKSDKLAIAHEFQEAVADVLAKKTLRAAQTYKVKTILLGGGVAANDALRERLAQDVSRTLPDVVLLLPEKSATGDNAAMIAVASFMQRKKMNTGHIASLHADGTLSL